MKPRRFVSDIVRSRVEGKTCGRRLLDVIKQHNDAYSAVNGHRRQPTACRARLMERVRSIVLIPSREAGGTRI